MQPSLDQTGVSPFGVSMAFPPLPMAFDMTAENIPTDTNGLTNIYDNIFDGLNGLFDDHYDKGMRISTYGDPMPSFGDV
ncbi:hypothetical protein PRZ48_002938 [Zasmidium cellare]|uniref:Uncharacterized protein n=1 Tax=Zasmidium cellare TaxID=395010 RepID=A0ABR0EV44_ZASCE|nr:hypothetical protein PRZ48_002938 [Zasmidium cellare]